MEMSARPRVLLVEPDRTSAMALATAVRQRGWEALSASDAITALSVAVKLRPDAVVVNMRLPGNGIETLKRLRGSAHTAVTPVVGTANRDDVERQQWLAAGAQECVDSLDGAIVCGAVQRHLSAPLPPAMEAPADLLRGNARLAALRASGLLDSGSEESYDRVTRLVVKLLGTPTALLSLVDKDRQFFKSQVGLPEPWASQRQTPLTHSFCQWVVSGREKITIDDARAHPLLKTNLAIRDLGVVAYAGAPVHGADGQALGSLCAIDAKPRQWRDADVSNLQDLARLVEACIAQGELARHPPTQAGGFDRYIGAAGDAIAAAVAILRRREGSSDVGERELMFALIEQYSHHLVQLNRMMQIDRALQ